MSATLLVRHNVADYATWRAVYDEVDALRVNHGCTAQRVLQLPDAPHAIIALHEFPTVDQARGFTEDPGLKEAMGRGGVTSPPRIEIFESA
ncbi:MAG: hypothetical protein U0P45_12160 [Acidimicrobiales bacterium]